MSIDVRHITRCENYPKSCLMGRKEKKIQIYSINFINGIKGLWSTRISL